MSAICAFEKVSLCLKLNVMQVVFFDGRAASIVLKTQFWPKHPALNFHSVSNKQPLPNTFN